MAKEVKERTPSSLNSKFGFESEFRLSSGHSQGHLEMVYEQGEYGELPDSLPLTPDPHLKTTIPLLRPHGYVHPAKTLDLTLPHRSVTTCNSVSAQPS